jgi:hypothetical protein
MRVEHGAVCEVCDGSKVPTTRYPLLSHSAVLSAVRLHRLQARGVLGLGGQVLDDIRHGDDGYHGAPEVRLHLLMQGASLGSQFTSHSVRAPYEAPGLLSCTPI